MLWCSSSSTAAGVERALAEVCEGAQARRADTGADPDLLVVHASPHHAAHAERIRDELARRWPGAALVGCSAAGVIGGGHEREQRPALSLTAAWLPAVEVRVAALSPAALAGDLTAWLTQLDVAPEQGPAFLVLVDPYSCDAARLAAALDAAWPGCPKIGGLASGGDAPGGHRLWAGAEVPTEGAVVVALIGDIELVPIVAQGVRPLGAAMVITRAERNLVLELDGQPAAAVFQERYAALDPADRRRLRGGPVVGLSVEGEGEAGRTPGPHDWLVRNLLGMDPQGGVLAVGAPVRAGQHLRLMVRDAAAAEEELRELLRGRARAGAHAPWQGALLYSCLGRGEAFFGHPDHDLAIVQQVLGPLPVGGFFCNGELGPVRGRTFLHGYTASLGLLRARAWD